MGFTLSTRDQTGIRRERGRSNGCVHGLSTLTGDHEHRTGNGGQYDLRISDGWAGTSVPDTNAAGLSYPTCHFEYDKILAVYVQARNESVWAVVGYSGRYGWASILV